MIGGIENLQFDSSYIVFSSIKLINKRFSANEPCWQKLLGLYRKPNKGIFNRVIVSNRVILTTESVIFNFDKLTWVYDDCLLIASYIQEDNNEYYSGCTYAEKVYTLSSWSDRSGSHTIDKWVSYSDSWWRYTPRFVPLKVTVKIDSPGILERVRIFRHSKLLWHYSNLRIIWVTSPETTAPKSVLVKLRSTGCSHVKQVLRTLHLDSIHSRQWNQLNFSYSVSIVNFL